MGSESGPVDCCASVALCVAVQCECGSVGGSPVRVWLCGWQYSTCCSTVSLAGHNTDSDRDDDNWSMFVTIALQST
jgi:hypothetical protein